MGYLTKLENRLPKSKRITIKYDVGYEWNGQTETTCILAKYLGRMVEGIDDVEYILTELEKEKKITKGKVKEYLSVIAGIDSGVGTNEHLKVVRKLATELGIEVKVRICN